MELEIKKVDTLPLLEQEGYPELPDLSPSEYLVFFGSKWQNAEMELAASCLVNACIFARQWQPVHEDKFLESLKINPMVVDCLEDNVARALWLLCEQGEVEVVMWNSEYYFIPTPEFAKFVLSDENLRTI